MEEKKEERKLQQEGTKGDNQNPQNKKPSGAHPSAGQATDEAGDATDNKEPTLRSATTDSSRVPKNPHDDMPTGGNIR
jgi:hypothetical protein